MKKLKSNETLDRLSELPDSAILQILSFLEMRDVVRTTVLSKRWENLWTTIPCLDFVEFEKNLVETRNFVNRVLMLWKGGKILKFKIEIWEQGAYELSGDINLWVRFAAERNVEELHLHLHENDDKDYVIPRFLFSCSSITKLSLVGCVFQFRGIVQWHQLKSLKFEVYSITGDELNQVVSAAPLLEIFDLEILSESEENLSIRSSSLKKLSITCPSTYFHMKTDLSLYPVLTIWAPNLVALVLSGDPYGKCLMKDVSSLIDVNLDFSARWDIVLRETLGQILPALQHVEVITLSSWCFKVLQVMKGENSLSPLPNVKKLKFTCDFIEPCEVVCLLEIFPNLKMLDIDRRSFVDYPCSLQDIGEYSLNYEENTIKSLMMQLRIVEIGWQKHETSLYEFIEFFLKHATMLEKVVIQKRIKWKDESDDMFIAAEKLLRLQRSFPNTELVFCKI